MRGLAVSLVLSTFVAAAPAIAQPSQNTIIASEAFERGRKLAAAGNWKDACTAFEQSQRAEAAFGTQYNLAGCYVEIKKLASAWALYSDLVQRDTNAGRKADSDAKAKALVPRIPKLLINAPDAPEGLTITLDGAPAFPGTPISVDLGTHAVIAKAPKHADKTWTPSVTKEGETVTVEVRLLPNATAAPTREPVTTTNAPADETIPPTLPIELRSETPGKKPLWPKLVIGGGVVLVGLGIGFGVAASSKKTEATDICDDDEVLCSDGSTELVEANGLMATARSRARYSTIFTLSGIAVVGLGVVLSFVIDNEEQESSTTVSVGGGGSPLGLTFGGAF